MAIEKDIAVDPDDLEANPFKGKTGIVRLYHAFLNSCAGFRDAFRHEDAFRQEVLLAIILIPAAFFVTPSPVERALLIGSVLLLMIVELLNTCVEVVVDRISHERHSLSKRAKDIGSAAVFVAIVLLVMAWGLIALPRLAG